MTRNEQGTVTREPYVGDSDVIVAECVHGDYKRVFKGANEHAGWKALKAHFDAVHGED